MDRIILAIVYVALFIGWWLNAWTIYLAATGPDQVSGWRVFGAFFFPLGGVMGWF